VNGCPWSFDGYASDDLFAIPLECAQPYTSLIVQEVLYDPGIDITRLSVGAVSFDRANGLLYVIGCLADGDKSGVHVRRVGADKALP